MLPPDHVYWHLRSASPGKVIVSDCLRLDREASERIDERLRVRPGISGLAQLRLPPDTDFESVRKKLAYDLYYVQCVNPWLDLKLVIFTAWRFVESIMGTACQLIYIPDARTINEKVVDIFGEEIDLTIQSETRH